MELFDIVDEQGNPTGQTVERTEAHALGICHRTAHVWLVNEDQVLLQRRAQGKDSFPGCYDTSSAGHIPAGCEPLESALRELWEELGLIAQPEELSFVGNFRAQYEKEFYGKPFRDNEVVFVYALRRAVPVSELHLQLSEVEDAAWFDIEDVYCALQPPRDSRFCVPSDGFALIRDWCRREKE